MRHQRCKFLIVNGQGGKLGEDIIMFALKTFLNSFRAAGAVSDFDRILNWKLLRGSHVFPGPDGGTCVNEAAIVAAGYPYCAVRSIEDCPPSFSRTMATYAMFLNDLIDRDELRREVLMPFVVRLDGSADAPAIERERAELIVLSTASTILAPALLRHGFIEAAEKLRHVGSPYDLVNLGRRLFDVRRPTPPAWIGQALADLADAAYACTRDDFAGAAKDAAIVAANIAQGMQRMRRRGHRDAARVYRQAGAILDAALKRGNDEAVRAPEAAGRLEKAKRKATPAGLVPVS
jgi:hypothetical protein